MSEQKYIRQFVMHSWKLWLGGLVIGLVLGGVISNGTKPSYDGLVSFTVSKSQPITQDKANFYLYDGYYNQQAANDAKADLADWIKSPRTVQDVFNKAGISNTSSSVAALGQTFKVSDSLTNHVDVSFNEGNQTDAQKIGDSLVSVVKNSYNVTDVVVTASDPLIVAQKPAKTLTFAGITIAVLALAFVLSLLIHYFRNEQ